MKKTFLLKGLDCANCAAKLEHAIKKIDGVKEASISFFTQKMVIECDENTSDEIIDKIKKIIKKIEPDIKVEAK